MNDKFLRVCGDIHGYINTPHHKKNICYLDLIKDCKYSVQLGDMGFNYSGLKNVSLNHRFILGNHDNYDDIPKHALGDYGMCNMDVWSFFYVRGAWSIDIKQRQRMMVSGMSPTIWWKQEELSPQQMQDCYEEYVKTKPSVVMTHSCPSSIAEKVGNPGIWKYFGWDKPRVSNTQLLLQEMFDAWQPDLWIFGHMHRDWFGFVEDTHFICVDELGFLDFDEDWRIL